MNGNPYTGAVVIAVGLVVILLLLKIAGHG